MINLIQFTENDKRFIVALLLVVILLLVIIGYASLLVKKIMDFQARTADDFLHDVYKTKTITEEKKLRRYGMKKNKLVFFKQATIPMIILAVAWLFFLLYGLIAKNGDFSKIDVWDYGTPVFDSAGKILEPAKGGTGFGTLFYKFDWSQAESVEFFLGIKLYGKPPALNVPHFSQDAWFSYIFIPLNIVAVVWYLVAVQAYIARTIRIFKISATIFKKTLDKPVSK